ncbi:cell wall anchor protein [Psychroserpens luteus]|uniref:Cell wall anchor protein n=1 Tax=Psychroserpens luteus TaxID=1434066 RepID=A0ABW5ZNQ3_9FLAO|nr:cell wall anchor protein [Psychroserpens luteus]
MKNIKLQLTILTLAAFTCFNYNAIAQVGIGTITPDASAMLDLTSTDKGMLAPRMTSIQRIAISSPAEGLLVFDTDENVFYFYNGGSWLPLEGAEKRNNYKLVKSVADLADELVGGKYVLNEDFVYEINGTVTFDFPIDLNGANLIGLDTGEDVIVNGSSSALFSGTKGGRLKDIFINANGKQVFDITGTGVENVIGYSVVITSASSIGTLSNLGVVFFSVLQIVNSSDGLDVSNINSFFAESSFWTESNAGTFLTFSGTFGNLQLANGRVSVDTGETGIDVSADPTITKSASLKSIDFSGSGNYIAGYANNTYSGYNFTKNWDVDCTGIPTETDGYATGNINLDYAVGSGASTTFSGTGTSSRKKIEGNTTSTNLFRFSSSANNRITYEGNKKRYFSLSASLSFQGDSNNNIFIFYMSKNGTVLEETKVYREVGTNNDVGALPLVGTVELEPNDYVEVWVERYTGSGDLLTVSLNLIAR